ncbi:MAG: response regulator [Thermodesulfobacteria bacterium]|nr:response regulator [Thermodesulfobacteriota bacterium]
MKNSTILVIEDDLMNRKLFGAVLEMAGHEHVIVEDAERGLEVARELLPALILMDIKLPGMDGLTATKIIREDPELKDIPVIALTAFATKDDERKALDAGCTDYISKPIDRNAFLEKIASYLA